MFVEAQKVLDQLEAEGDELTGVRIVRRALEEPLRQIAANAGHEGAIIVERARQMEPGYGFNALTGEFVDMVAEGIIDPAKVTRSALENAASIAGMVLTTETLIAEVPEEEPPAPGGAGGMGGMPPM